MKRSVFIFRKWLTYFLSCNDLSGFPIKIGTQISLLITYNLTNFYWLKIAKLYVYVISKLIWDSILDRKSTFWWNLSSDTKKQNLISNFLKISLIGSLEKYISYYNVHNTYSRKSPNQNTIRHWAKKLLQCIILHSK